MSGRATGRPRNRITERPSDRSEPGGLQPAGQATCRQPARMPADQATGWQQTCMPADQAPGFSRSMPSFPQNATGRVWECRILGEKRYSTGSGSAPRLVFCRCARDVVAFFAKYGIEWEKPGCVAMKLSIKVIVALLNCRAANLQADSRIAFRLAQAKSPMTAGHRALVLKKGEGREGGECASRPRGFCSIKELLRRRSPCVI